MKVYPNPAMYPNVPTPRHVLMGQELLRVVEKGEDTEKVKALLAQGAAVNIQDDKKRTAFFLAAAKGYTEVAKALIAAGADLNEEAAGATPLILAARDGHIDVVRAMIAAGADLNMQVKKGNLGDTALMNAAVEGRDDIVRVLLEAGAKTEIADSDGATALICAVCLGHLSTARLLLDYGADVDHANNTGQTALYIVKTRGHTAFAEMLEQEPARRRVLRHAAIEKAFREGLTEDLKTKGPIRVVRKKDRLNI